MNLRPAPDNIGRICIDLDGTLAASEWPSPEIGEPIETGVNIILTAQEYGYEVIVYTARPSSHSPRIWAWLQENGLYGLVYDVVCGKPVADLYVDDKAYNPFIDVEVGVEAGQGHGAGPVDGMLTSQSAPPPQDVGDGAATSDVADQGQASSKAAVPLTYEDVWGNWVDQMGENPL